MRLFRDTFRDRRTGRRVPAQRWSIEFRDHTERARRIVAHSDKAASEALGRHVERLAELRIEGRAPDRELARVIEAWPARIRDRLAGIGLLDAQRIAGARPLTDLLKDFRAHVQAREATPKHVGHTVQRAKRLLQACRFTTFSDISAEPVERFLRAMREGEPEAVARYLGPPSIPLVPRVERYRRELTTDGLSAKASNHWLAAAQQFCRWAVSRGLAQANPLAVLEPVNARMDRRHVRRAISEAELRKLIQTAHDGPTILGVPGPVRAMVYLLAVETGLRAAELASLRVASFDLRNLDAASVELPARDTKNREDTRLPLRPSTARALARHLAGRGALSSAFGLRRGWKSAELLRGDLGRAGIGYKDESLRTFDFHALRGQAATRLLDAGASPKVVQRALRHATTELTVGLYATLRPGEERRALDLLGDLAPTSADAARATGTDGAEICSASCPASKVANDGQRCETVANGNATGVAAGASAAQRMEPEAGFEPPAPRAADQPQVPVDPAGCDALADHAQNVPGALLGVEVPADPALTALIERWPSLSAEQRTAVLRAAGLARSTTGTTGGDR